MGWKNNKGFVAAANLALVFIIGVVDYATGYELSFSVFYLIPILVATWLAGLWPGIFLSVVSAVVWGIVDKISEHQYSSAVIPYWNSAVRLGFFTINTIMLAKLMKLYAHEKEMSRADFLTGISNLRSFYGAVEEEIGRAKRYGHPFTISYIDIDNFKHVNDRYGHMMGDRLLTQVAKTIRDGIRTVDVAGRLGGDEFAILMPETGGKNVMATVERLQGKLQDTIEEHDWPVSFSIGVATFRTPPESVDAVIAKADDLMYFVKTSGKNNIKHEVFG